MFTFSKLMPDTQKKNHILFQKSKDSPNTTSKPIIHLKMARVKSNPLLARSSKQDLGFLVAAGKMITNR